MVLIAGHAVMVLTCNVDWRDQRMLYLATVETSPVSPVSQALAGEVYLSDPHVQERARLHYEQALRLSGDKQALRCLAHNAVGKLSMNLRDLDVAVWHLREAVELNKSAPVPRSNLALALSTIALSRGWPQAWEMCRRKAEEVLRLHDSHPDAYYVLGLWQLEWKKDAVRAAELFAEAVGLDPGFYGAYYALAVAYLEQGNLQKALRAARHAFTIEPMEQVRALIDVIQQRIGEDQ